MLIRGVGKGSWWCYWAACRSRALWSLSKERGLATLHPLGACPPPQKLYLILRPCPLFPLATRVLAFMPIKKVYHYSLLCDGTPIALPLPKIPQSIDKAYIKPHTLPSSAGLPTHHTHTPCLVSSAVNRLTCITLSLSQLPYHARLYFQMTAAAVTRTP